MNGQSYVVLMYNTTMIPDLPPSCTDADRLQFYDTLSANLTDQSTIHLNWHTHRQNPSTCWICDMGILMSKVMQLTTRYITKSTLDTETEFSQEDDSDSEIENESLNRDEEPQPEYELEDEQVGVSD